ncbi:MAG: glycosyltransferase [Smithella sp.]
MRKICILTSVHTPFDVRIFHKEAKSLASAGYEVVLIAQHEKEETIDGVNIINLNRPRNRIQRMTTTVWSLFRKAIAVDAELYHFHDPELIPVGLMLRRLGKEVIFDIHEDTRRQITRKQYIPLLLRSCLSRVYGLCEDFACKRFSALVTPQEKMTLRYRALNAAVTVENFVDTSLYQRRQLDWSKPVLFHAGALTEDRGLYNMMNAARQISGEFLFYVAGQLSAKTKASTLYPLTYLGVLGQEAIVEVYRRANIGIILYDNVGQYSMAGAIKCYEYMASCMPIIMPDFGEWAGFNDTCRCGINVNVRDAKGVAAAVSYLVDNPDKARQMGENGRKWVEKSYSWQSAFEKLLRLYGEVLT